MADYIMFKGSHIWHIMGPDGKALCGKRGRPKEQNNAPDAAQTCAKCRRISKQKGA